MFRRSLVLALLAAAMSGMPGAAHAQAVPAPLTPVDRGWIDRIQDQLGTITTLQARFQQIAPDGRRSTGMASMSRPGRMRFDYDKPSPLLLVANQGQVVYQDRDIGQVTTIPLDRTPLGLLLAPTIALSGAVTITGFSHRNGQIQMTLVRTATPGEGSLTLLLNDHPLSLHGWVANDAQGRETEIDLFDIRTPASLPASLFDLPKQQD
ncbi:LolA family protein [Tanticharoenia sakaeratensis]|uniref:Outer-membrane lipoprotein carrier protein n=1 Tax=Tanticharoenia sakaeratensis NBRC 103193 TaxID=1231623 RepID=A0A0D6MI10_9PROT|nr:outer membrane lipoprotein carrier protein LolA [Tanticharoenia sakaeratensis]GAN53247.1 outer-membrane lipoprotein carrier protein [Tanticharoenia sakaeratensis NBRC 103193]GBQ21192.1 outer-membrane lipoprotein carrier protein [Tanticharoenia sakaeratensis NBRC 103193]